MQLGVKEKREGRGWRELSSLSLLSVGFCRRSRFGCLRVALVVTSYLPVSLRNAPYLSTLGSTLQVFFSYPLPLFPSQMGRWSSALQIGVQGLQSKALGPRVSGIGKWRPKFAPWKGEDGVRNARKGQKQILTKTTY